jgi:hypothetical protein
MTTESETTTDPRDYPGWSYAPLIAFAVSLLPSVLVTFESFFYGRLSWNDFGLFVFLSAANSAFAGLFFVTRWKLTKAIEQRLPVRSINVAMWSSLILMGIVASIPYLFALVGPTGLDPHEKGLAGIVVVTVAFFLTPQFVVMPLVGVFGWFMGREFYRMIRSRAFRRRTSLPSTLSLNAGTQSRAEGSARSP